MINPPRTRQFYFILLLITILLGLASRHFSHRLPPLLAKNTGDVLYATMAFWLAGLIFPRLSTSRVAGLAFAFCVAIEFAKLIHMPWLVAARHRTWGHLILGTGFHVSNLICYGIGVLLGAGIEWGQRHSLRKGLG